MFSEIKKRWKNLKHEKQKRDFLNYYKDTTDNEIYDIVQHIRRTQKFEMMNCNLSRDYANIPINCYKDEESGLNYILDESGGNKIFFPRTMTKEATIGTYRAIKKEQDIFSPHCYLDEKDIDAIINAHKAGKYIRVFELGAMEGLFSLSLINYVDEVHIFECNAQWIEALRYTFQIYGAKVKIINKYVSNINTYNEITLDNYINKLEKRENLLDIVKMDIEGAETKALSGMSAFISNDHKFIAFVCAYHRKDDEKNIRSIFADYPIENTKGYFCFFDAKDYEKPYVRRCLLKIKNI